MKTSVALVGDDLCHQLINELTMIFTLFSSPLMVFTPVD